MSGAGDARMPDARVAAAPGPEHEGTCAYCKKESRVYGLIMSEKNEVLCRDCHPSFRHQSAAARNKAEAVEQPHVNDSMMEDVSGKTRPQATHKCLLCGRSRTTKGALLTPQNWTMHFKRKIDRSDPPVYASVCLGEMDLERRHQLGISPELELQPNDQVQKEQKVPNGANFKFCLTIQAYEELETGGKLENEIRTRFAAFPTLNSIAAFMTPSKSTGRKRGSTAPEVDTPIKKLREAEVECKLCLKRVQASRFERHLLEVESHALLTEEHRELFKECDADALRAEFFSVADSSASGPAQQMSAAEVGESIKRLERKEGSSVQGESSDDDGIVLKPTLGSDTRFVILDFDDFDSNSKMYGDVHFKNHLNVCRMQARDVFPGVFDSVDEEQQVFAKLAHVLRHELNTEIRDLQCVKEAVEALEHQMDAVSQADVLGETGDTEAEGKDLAKKEADVVMKRFCASLLAISENLEAAFTEVAGNDHQKPNLRESKDIKPGDKHNHFYWTVDLGNHVENIQADPPAGDETGSIEDDRSSQSVIMRRWFSKCKPSSLANINTLLSAIKADGRGEEAHNENCIFLLTSGVWEPLSQRHGMVVLSGEVVVAAFHRHFDSLVKVIQDDDDDTSEPDDDDDSDPEGADKTSTDLEIIVSLVPKSGDVPRSDSLLWPRSKVTWQKIIEHYGLSDSDCSKTILAMDNETRQTADNDNLLLPKVIKDARVIEIRIVSERAPYLPDGQQPKKLEALDDDAGPGSSAAEGMGVVGECTEPQRKMALVLFHRVLIVLHKGRRPHRSDGEWSVNRDDEFLRSLGLSRAESEPGVRVWLQHTDRKTELQTNLETEPETDRFRVCIRTDDDVIILDDLHISDNTVKLWKKLPTVEGGEEGEHAELKRRLATCGFTDSNFVDHHIFCFLDNPRNVDRAAPVLVKNMMASLVSEFCSNYDSFCFAVGSHPASSVRNQTQVRLEKFGLQHCQEKYSKKPGEGIWNWNLPQRTDSVQAWRNFAKRVWDEERTLFVVIDDESHFGIKHQPEQGHDFFSTHAFLKHDNARKGKPKWPSNLVQVQVTATDYCHFTVQSRVPCVMRVVDKREQSVGPGQQLLPRINIPAFLSEGNHRHFRDAFPDFNPSRGQSLEVGELCKFRSPASASASASAEEFAVRVRAWGTFEEHTEWATRSLKDLALCTNYFEERNVVRWPKEFKEVHLLTCGGTWTPQWILEGLSDLLPEKREIDGRPGKFNYKSYEYLKTSGLRTETTFKTKQGNWLEKDMTVLADYVISLIFFRSLLEVPMEGAQRCHSLQALFARSEDQSEEDSDLVCRRFCVNLETLQNNGELDLSEEERQKLVTNPKRYSFEKLKSDERDNSLEHGAFRRIILKRMCQFPTCVSSEKINSALAHGFKVPVDEDTWREVIAGKLNYFRTYYRYSTDCVDGDGKSSLHRLEPDVNLCWSQTDSIVHDVMAQQPHGRGGAALIRVAYSGSGGLFDIFLKRAISFLCLHDRVLLIADFGTKEKNLKKLKAFCARPELHNNPWGERLKRNLLQKDSGNGSFAEQSGLNLLYEHLNDIPIFLIIVDRCRLGDTLPHSLRAMDLRMRHAGSDRSNSDPTTTLTATRQELGRLCKYTDSPGYAVVNEKILKTMQSLDSLDPGETTGVRLDKFVRNAWGSKGVVRAGNTPLKTLQEWLVAFRGTDEGRSLVEDGSEKTPHLLFRACYAPTTGTKESAADFNKSWEKFAVDDQRREVEIGKRWINNRIVLSAPPQVGKTGAYLRFLLFLKDTIGNRGFGQPLDEEQEVSTKFLDLLSDPRQFVVPFHADVKFSDPFNGHKAFKFGHGKYHQKAQCLRLALLGRSIDRTENRSSSDSWVDNYFHEFASMFAEDWRKIREKVIIKYRTLPGRQNLDLPTANKIAVFARTGDSSRFVYVTIKDPHAFEALIDFDSDFASVLKLEVPGEAQKQTRWKLANNSSNDDNLISLLEQDMTYGIDTALANPERIYSEGTPVTADEPQNEGNSTSLAHEKTVKEKTVKVKILDQRSLTKAPRKFVAIGSPPSCHVDAINVSHLLEFARCTYNDATMHLIRFKLSDLCLGPADPKEDRAKLGLRWVFVPTHRDKVTSCWLDWTGSVPSITQRVPIASQPGPRTVQVLVVRAEKKDAYLNALCAVPDVSAVVFVLPAQIEIDENEKVPNFLNTNQGRASEHRAWKAEKGLIGYARLCIQLFCAGHGISQAWILDDNIRTVEEFVVVPREATKPKLLRKEIRIEEAMQRLEMVFSKDVGTVYKELQELENDNLRPLVANDVRSHRQQIDDKIYFLGRDDPQKRAINAGNYEQYLPDRDSIGLVGMHRGFETNFTTAFGANHVRLYSFVLVNFAAATKKKVFYRPIPFWEDILFHKNLIQAGLKTIKYHKFNHVKDNLQPKNKSEKKQEKVSAEIRWITKKFADSKNKPEVESIEFRDVFQPADETAQAEFRAFKEEALVGLRGIDEQNHNAANEFNFAKFVNNCDAVLTFTKPHPSIGRVCNILRHTSNVDKDESLGAVVIQPTEAFGKTGTISCEDTVFGREPALYLVRTTGSAELVDKCLTITGQAVVVIVRKQSPKKQSDSAEDAMVD